jgi:hypothetical protein
VVGFQLLQVEEINSSSVRFKVSMAQNNTLETIGQGVLDEVSGKMKIEMLPSPAPESLNRGTYTMELYLSDQIFTLPENVGETFKFTAVYTSTRLSSDGNLHLTKTVTQSFQTTAPAFGAPRIERLNPDVGPIGRIVHIEGVGFSPENGKNRVTFVGPEGDRIETQVITASPGELVVWVPEEAVTGTVRVEVADLESNDYRFRVPFHPAAGLFFEQLLAGTAALPRLLLSQPAEEDSAYNQTPFFGEIRIKEATFELDAGSIQVDALTEDQEVGRIYFYNRVNGSESSLLMIYRGLESETGRYRFEGMAGKNHLMTILLSDNSPDGVTFKVEVPYVINTGLTWLFEFSEAIYLPPFPTGAEINVKTTVRSDQWHPIPGLAMEVEILAKAVAQ